MKLLRRIISVMMALVVLAGTAGLIWADQRYPAPATPAGQPRVVAVPAGTSMAVCPGALRLATSGEGEVVYDPRFDPAPSFTESLARLVVEGEAGQVRLLDGSAPIRLHGPLAIDQQTVSAEPVLIEAESSSQGEPASTGGEESAQAAGSTFQLMADGDLRGVAAASCVPPVAESWLVAGSTEPGSSARLILVNPGLTTVTADLELWDGNGLVEAVGLTGLVIPPSAQRAVLLEGFKGAANRLAVHVTAAGGEVAVFLQHSRLEGLTQGGVELAVAGQPPATLVNLPFVSVTESDFDSARASVLRVLNPGSVQAVISVELWGPDGLTTLPGLEEALVSPGRVSDLWLAGLPAGQYMAVIKSDQPLVGAALSLRPGVADGPEEFAWTASATEQGHGFLGLPNGNLTADLLVSSEVAAEVELTPLDDAGQAGPSRIVQVAARSAVKLEVPPLAAGRQAAAIEFTWRGASGFIALGVSFDDESGTMISAVLPRSRPATPSTVEVYPAGP
ncbi:MAG: DUF5719 family protein [Bifidobacteriaceae bacterium]|jgi:hypothetical protein|nr:DUF5719 family protein [Bifidobacteriaceae bacterium]